MCARLSDCGQAAELLEHLNTEKLQQHSPAELAVITGTLSVLPNTAATPHGGLPGPGNGVGVDKKRGFTFYLIVINGHLNSHMWLVATVLDNASLYFFHVLEVPHAEKNGHTIIMPSS